MTADPSAIEKPEDAGDDYRLWRNRLDMAGKEEENWRKRGQAIVDRYRDEERADGTRKKLNIFWSNVETLKPAVYSRTPQPDVRRRFLDPNPVARQTAEILERALSFSIDDTEFDNDMESVRDDMLIPGRGLARVRYEAEFEEVELEAIPTIQANPLTGLPEEGPPQFFHEGQPMDPDRVDEETGQAFAEVKTSERAFTEYVYWEDFRHGPGRNWSDVPWVGFRHKMTRAEGEKAFGEIFKKVNLTHSTLTLEDDKANEGTAEPKDIFKRAIVWEIWDKDSGQVIWLSDGLDKILEEEDFPFELKGTFPIPKPLYAYETTDSLVPIPEFAQYQDQANELDRVTDRIDSLVRMVKAAGLYDATVKEMISLQNAKDGEMMPIQTASMLLEKGGLANAIFMWPIRDIAQVLQVMLQHREQLRQEIFEITGISDIVRGSTKASETFGAQRLKANFGNLRMTPRQRPMERFVRDIMRIMAEIVAELFDEQTLAKMTGLQVGPEVMQLMEDDGLRGFMIDIETDSTVQPDADLEKEEAVELLGSTTQYLQAAGVIVQTPGGDQMVPLLLELLKFGMRRFKISRTLEDVIDETAQNLINSSQNPPPPPPDPQMEKIEADRERSEAQIELDRQKAAAEIQLKKEMMAAELQLKVRAQEQQVAADIRKEEIRAQPQVALNVDAQDSIGQVAQTLQALATDQSSTMAQASQVLAAAAAQIAEAAEAMAAPKRIIRDQQGRPVGVEPVAEAG